MHNLSISLTYWYAAVKLREGLWCIWQNKKRRVICFSIKFRFTLHCMSFYIVYRSDKVIQCFLTKQHLVYMTLYSILIVTYDTASLGASIAYTLFIDLGLIKTYPRG